MVADEVRDAVRDHTRFTAPGTGEDQKRTFGIGDGFALLRV